MNASRLLRFAFPVAVRSVSTGTEPVRTALCDLHASKGGKLVDFAGFLLPVQYEGQSITQSHLHTRRQCSVFDVSHMLQTKVHGRDRKELLERVTTADVQGLAEGRSSLTVFTDNSTGGILDDLIVTNAGDKYMYVVSNAGRRDHDKQLLKNTQEAMRAEGKDVTLEFLSLDEYSLIAVQGPAAGSVMQPLCDIPLDKLSFMASSLATIGNLPGCRISRCGYTGEDGFEISVLSSEVSGLVEMLLRSQSVQLAGLGARDSLRLEAGLCLYGSDIDATVTPVEASLSWLVAKSRREKKDFPGAEVILKQLSQGVKKRRVGLKLQNGPPARHDCALMDENKRVLGTVTSGCPSPSLGGSVAMGYIDGVYAKSGTKILVEVRGKTYPALVSKMPFITCRYYT